MIRLIFALCLSINIAFADIGDTTIIQVHNNVDMTWYGHYKKWGEFPSEVSLENYTLTWAVHHQDVVDGIMTFIYF